MLWQSLLVPCWLEQQLSSHRCAISSAKLCQSQDKVGVKLAVYLRWVTADIAVIVNVGGVEAICSLLSL